MNISFAELEKALSSLEKALGQDKNDITRDASIQRFEFCVELSWKTAKKVMGTNSTAPKQVIREMAQNQFIDDMTFWLKAIDQRNLSAHTYKEALAEEVYAFAQSFLPQAHLLLVKLKSR